MVNIYVLNKDFQSIGVIDTYESLIWTDRFGSYGDFEIYTAFDKELVSLCAQDNYLYINESEHMMIIEGLEIESDPDTGNKLKITGRSLESILSRRIVWTQTTISNDTTLHDAIKYLIEDSILDPQPYSGTRANKRRNATQQKTSDERKIPNFIFEDSTDPYVLDFKMEKTQYTGDNLYETIINLLEKVAFKTIGYRITVDNRYIVTSDTEKKSGKTYYELVEGQYVMTQDTTFQNGKTYYEFTDAFIFKLYTGVDRSYAQKEYFKTRDLTRHEGKVYYKLVDNEYVIAEDDPFVAGVTYYEHQDIRPYVIFSPQFDNVINSNYIDSTEAMTNVTLVMGEGEEDQRKSLIVGEESGLIRRELFTDARDLRSEDYGSSAKYNEAMKNRGYSKLKENSRVTSYEGQVDATRQFVYGKNDDFYMGDVIQMANEYGIGGNARVVEWVMSESSDGFETYPTFDAVQVVNDTTTEEDNTNV